ncbi:MAG: twin-arginine translocase subunit TatC [Candidatus Hydrothermarchaeales archaeon]
MKRRYGVPGDSDQELEEHMVELAQRLALVVIIVGFITIIAFFLVSQDLIVFMRNDLLPSHIKVIVLHPVEYIYERIQISMVLAIILCNPLITYEIYKFMRPGLFPSERMFYLTVVPSSMFLFLFGSGFAYTLVAPIGTKLLIRYTETRVAPIIVLEFFVKYVSFVLITFGVIFEIPLVIYLLLKMGLVKVEALKKWRKLIYFGVFVLSVAFSPDPTPITPVLMTLMVIVLYEVSLAVSQRII